MAPVVVCPYIQEEDAIELKNILGWEIPCIFEEDTGRIGSDLMYQKLWGQCKDNDIIIFHADMRPMLEDKNNDWYYDLCNYADKYPETGMLGCKLLYPKDKNTELYYIQSAGGKFSKNLIPEHFGSGLEKYTGKVFKELEEDKGQYDYVREVAWSTFGALYIRRKVINQVGNFDPAYEWSYNRDVDYCLQARKLGWKIYQTPISLLHFESKDNKILRSQKPDLNEKEQRNLKRLISTWKSTGYMENINKRVEELNE